MSKIITDDTHYNNIATVIQSKLGTDTKYAPAEMPDGVQAVFAKGYDEGEAIGIEVGKQAYVNEFWSKVPGAPGVNTSNGLIWYYLFAGVTWTDDTFNPPFDIKPTGSAPGMFYNSQMTDYTAVFNEVTGNSLDTSGVTYASGMWQNAKATHLPVLNLTKATNISNLLYSCSDLVIVDGMIFSETTGTAVNGASSIFTQCTNLQTCIASGSISVSLGLGMSTKLDRPSIESFVNTLSDTVTGKTLTLSLTAVNKAFETSEGAADGSTSLSSDWIPLITPKSNQYNGNWSINLV